MNIDIVTNESAEWKGYSRRERWTAREPHPASGADAAWSADARASPTADTS